MRRDGVPVIASHFGYKLTDNPVDIERQINSYLKRITNMYRAVQGLKKAKQALILKEKRQKKQGSNGTSGINYELFEAQVSEGEIKII